METMFYPIQTRALGIQDSDTTSDEYRSDRHCLGLLPDNLVLVMYICMECSGIYTVDGISLAVPSAEHPPVWEQIPRQLISRVKGV
jgi:hypothetical protein